MAWDFSRSPRRRCGSSALENEKGGISSSFEETAAVETAGGVVRIGSGVSGCPNILGASSVLLKVRVDSTVIPSGSAIVEKKTGFVRNGFEDVDGTEARGISSFRSGRRILSS